MSGGYLDIRYETRGHVGVLTLDRPDVHNALRERTYRELEDAVRGCTARVLVITGAGRSFCSGDDVRELMGGGAEPPRPGQGPGGAEPGGAEPGGAEPGENATAQAGAPRLLEPRLTPAADALLGTDMPVIAAVNGPAVGWGMELALFADLRVAARSARFGELFVKRGLCSDVAGIGRLSQLVGREHAAELLFTGELIDAERAVQIGLAGRLAEDADLMDTALALADRIAANPPLAVAALKSGLRRALDPDWDDLGRWVTTRLGELFATEDHREGVRSFLEKREPRYVGR